MTRNRANSTKPTVTARPIERLVFFGTPQFAVPTLDALSAAGRTPELVVSQPTRSAGRGRQSTPPPVAQWALDHDVPLVQTDRVKAPEFLATLAEIEPCLAIVVAFGQIFRRPLLALPRLGCMNLHASLLPAYRGASPIVAAIRHSESRTGVSTMMMERGLDSGPVLLQEELEIGPDETSGELTPRLSGLGADLVVRTIDELEAGKIVALEQDHDRATVAPMLDRADGAIDWACSAQAIHDLVRAFDPWPGTRAVFRESTLAIKRTRAAAAPIDLDDLGRVPRPGEVVGLTDEALWVGAGSDSLVGLLEVQRPGRKAVSARDFVNGERVQAGDQFELPTKVVSG